jgi:hypothetical protein
MVRTPEKPPFAGLRYISLGQPYYLVCITDFSAGGMRPRNHQSMAWRRGCVHN